MLNFFMQYKIQLQVLICSYVLSIFLWFVFRLYVSSYNSKYLLEGFIELMLMITVIVCLSG